MRHIILIFILSIAGLQACNTSRIALQKSKLLDATMDPAKSSTVSTLNSEPFGWNERGASDLGSSFGSSCPTCGG